MNPYFELLSPSNKRAGDARKQYLAKRRELLRSPAHLVELDLVQRWNSMPEEGMSWTAGLKVRARSATLDESRPSCATSKQ
jgi:hypothetical protein